jgi:hypothetical protein
MREPPVPDLDDPVGDAADPGVVGHDEQGPLLLLRQPPELLEDLGA